MADIRHDPLTGRWVAIAPERASRPGAATPASDEREACPFCAGHEDRTPPETLRLGGGPTGWGVRVVPNLYPALERHEVVIHGPEHVHSIGALSDATIDLVAEAWQRRARDTGGICFPLINEGHEAGASLPHSHSQLAWLPAPAPAVIAERGLPEVIHVLERDGPRVAALEVLIATQAVSNLIREGKTFQIPSIMQVGKSVGMVSLNDALMELVTKKLVTPDEAYSKSVDKGGFEGLIKRAGLSLEAKPKLQTAPA